MTSLNETETEIKSKIAVGNKCYYALGPIITLIKIKIRLYKTTIRPAVTYVAETYGAETHAAETHAAETHAAETCGAETRAAETYGAETWTLTSKIEKMLMTWERKILRKTYGSTKENGQWGIKTNEELRTKRKSQDIVTVIKIRRLEWLGNVSRMDETRCVKKIFEGKLDGRRGRGRPRLRWINDMEDDLRKHGVKRWRTKALNGEEWAIIKEAKAKLKGQ